MERIPAQAAPISMGGQRNKAESEREIAQFKELLTAISGHLVKTKRTWKDIARVDCGPCHRGWSRLLSSLKKSRDVYRLIQRDRREGEPRNENEQKLKTETNITAMTDRRWNSVYKNLSLLKCNLRIKYEEWRIAWGRQELNRDKRHYPGCTTQSTKCSYCNISVETEHHIYTACPRLEQFWIDARNMVYLEWGILVPLNLKCNRLFGMEKERPDDLLNIFYRSVRYTIFSSRATRHLPSPETP